MGILGTFTNYARKALDILGVTPVSSGTRNEKVSGSSNAVVSQSNPGENVDIADIQNPAGTKVSQPKNSDQRSIGAIEESIKGLCTKNSLDYNIIKTGLFNMSGIKDSKELEELKCVKEEDSNFKEAQDKLNHYKLILNLAERAIIRAGKKRLTRDVDATQLVIVNTKLLFDSLIDGKISNTAELDDLERNEQLNKACENLLNGLDGNDIDAQIDAFEKQLKTAQKQKIAELSGLPEKQRLIEEQKINAQFRALRNQIYADVMATKDTITATDAITIVEGKDLGIAMQGLLKSRATDALKQVIAHQANFGFYEKILNAYHERGELKSPEMQDALKQYNTEITSWMGKEDVQNYQNSYVQARQNYENGNGEDYFTDEIFTSTAIGIGAGITVNNVMTAEERAEILYNWEQDAQQFSDCESVIAGRETAVQNYIKDHPEAKEIAEQTMSVYLGIGERVSSSKNVKSTKTNNCSQYKAQNTKDASYGNKQTFVAQTSSTGYRSISNPILKKLRQSKPSYKHINSAGKDNSQKVYPVKSCSDNTNFKTEAKKQTNPLKTEKKYQIKNTKDIAKALDNATSFDKVNADEKDKIVLVLSDTKRYKKFVPEVQSRLEAYGPVFMAYIVNSSSDSVVATLCEWFGVDEIKPLLNRELCYTIDNKIERLDN